LIEVICITTRPIIVAFKVSLFFLILLLSDPFILWLFSTVNYYLTVLIHELHLARIIILVVMVLISIVSKLLNFIRYRSTFFVAVIFRQSSVVLHDRFIFVSTSFATFCFSVNFAILSHVTTVHRCCLRRRFQQIDISLRLSHAGVNSLRPWLRMRWELRIRRSPAAWALILQIPRRWLILQSCSVITCRVQIRSILRLLHH